jgi:hypothetical protein
VRRSESIDAKKRDQLDLVRKQGRSLEALAKRHAEQLEQLQATHADEVRQLQRQHVRQLVDLWQQQGRQLGPWTEPVLEGELPRAFPRGGKVGHV